ncbi:TerD family protein [Deinococcus lacus]|uniref:TerD family protein n=1 Tax=Deinococcus lacus TaxID=392561 RepID=A0ABW1YH59_9DEIO
MRTLQAGERAALSDLGAGDTTEVTIEAGLSGTDVTAFGLQEGRLTDDRYMVFYNQPSSPEGAMQLLEQGPRTRFSVNLLALPPQITEVVFAATHSEQPFAGTLLRVNLGQATFDASSALAAEKAVMLLRLYRHAGQWRAAAIGQGFDGGLAALVQHFGGEVAAETAPSAPPAEAAPCTAAASSPQQGGPPQAKSRGRATQARH